MLGKRTIHVSVPGAIPFTIAAIQGLEKEETSTMGNRSKAKAGTNGETAKAEGKFSLISDEKLIALYQNLLKCSTRSKANGALRGHEAAVVGTAIDLGPGDVICFHEHGLHPGAPDGATIQNLLLAQAAGLRTSSRAVKPKANPKTKNGAATASGEPFVPTAIATALAHKTKKNGKIAVVFSSGHSHNGLREAIEIASVHGLPMIFVQPSNGKVTANGAKPKTAKNSTQPEIPWFPEITVDSNDLVAVYRVANESISRARLGRGPTVIACLPFSVPNSGNRNGRRAQDPVSNMEHYLRAKGLFDSKLKRGTLTEPATR